MTATPILERRGWIPMAACTTLCVGVACHTPRRVEPAVVANPVLGSMTIAVAPAVNLSGASDFDPNRFADLMASELTHATGIAVVPVSRVLGVLAVQGQNAVESPAHALELVELLGADAILVFAVTEYDPYDPPSIGISAQLYGTRPGPRHGTVDPVALSRQASAAATSPQHAPRRLLAQYQRVFDAAHDAVAADVRRFAEVRNADESPYGWRRYVVNQQEYIRYCCHATIRALLNGRDQATLADTNPEQ